MASKLKIGCRKFTQADQEIFAKYSGDENPMHMDPILARRLIAGEQVVHGINLTFWGLEYLAQKKLCTTSLSTLEVKFLRTAKLHEEINYYFIDSDKRQEKEIDIERSDGTKIANLKIGFRLDNLVFSFSRKEYKGPVQAIKDRTLEELDGLHGYVSIINKPAQYWPNAADSYGNFVLGALATTSALVGMECPGLHSLYSALEISFTVDNNSCDNILKYKVSRVDKRFKLVTIRIRSELIKGQLIAFRRPEPIQQASILELDSIVQKRAFEDEKALVIGGSRGIGETISKILITGGADVCITFSQGKEDAERVVNDLRLKNLNAFCSQLDVLDSDATNMEALIASFKPTALYYCATPFIFNGERGVVSEKLLSTFRQYYIDGFQKVFNAASRYNLKKIWYPSTVALDERPPNMVEYCIAKAEAEEYLNSLKTLNSRLQIHCPRLPRMTTDQTSNLLGLPGHDPIKYVLDSLSA